MMRQFLVLLLMLNASCSPAEKLAEERSLNKNEVVERLRQCWEVVDIVPSEDEFRLKYKMYISLDAGPWVGVSEKCKKMYISFIDPDGVSESLRRAIINNQPDESFQQAVVQLEVIGSIFPQQYNAYNIEYELRRVVDVELLDADPDAFYEKHVLRYR